MGSRRQAKEAGDNVLETYHFFPFCNLLKQLMSLQAVLFQCCCGIPVICSCSQAALSANLRLLSDQESTWPIKPSSLAADNCSEKRVFAKPVILSFPGCFCHGTAAHELHLLKGSRQL